MVYYSTLVAEEARITPILNFETDPETRSISIANKGFGPAHILAVEAAVDGVLYQLWPEGYGDISGIEDFSRNVMAPWGKHFFDADTFTAAFDDAVHESLTSNMPLPGDLIEAGKSLNNFALAGYERLPPSNQEAYFQWLRNGAGRMPRFDMRVCYCSFSGKTCRVTSYLSGPGPDEKSCRRDVLNGPVTAPGAS